MYYIKMMEYAKEIGMEKFDLNSSAILTQVIKDKKSEFYSAFNYRAWSYDNLQLLLEQSSNEDEITFLRSIITELSRYSEESFRKFIRDLMAKNYYNFLLRFCYSEIRNDAELMSLIISNLPNMNVTHDNFNNFWHGICNHNNSKDYRSEIYSTLIGSKRYDLLAGLVSKGDLNLAEKNDLVDCAAGIVQHIEFFQLKLPIQTFEHNPNLFKAFFLNGCSRAINCMKYIGYDDIIQFANADEEILKKIIEYAETSDDEFLNVAKRLKSLATRKEYLKIILDRRKNNMLSFFEGEAWSLENQIYYYNLKSSDSNVPDVSYQKYAYLSYKMSYNFYSSYYRKASYGDIGSSESFNNFDICMTIGEQIANGSLANSSIITACYKFIFETKSSNIHKLILALTNKDINNLHKLFNERGFTDYFKEFLLYDLDFISYSGENILNICQTPEYINYIRIMALDERMRKILFPFNINKDNIKEYFTESTITKKCIDRLFNVKGYEALIILSESGYPLEITDLEKSILLKCSNIKSTKQKELFLDYCLRNKESLREEQIDGIFSLIIKASNSNSFEIRKQADGIIGKLINMDNYMEAYNDLEHVLIDGAAPEFMKRFAIYKILYGDKDIREDSNVTSPILKSVSREEADRIILNRLFKVALSTSSLDIKNYLSILQNGWNLYARLKDDSVLSPQEEKLLHDYRERLEFLAQYLLKLKYESLDSDYQTIRNIEQLYMSKYQPLKFPPDFHWPFFNDSIFKDLLFEFDSMIEINSYIARYDLQKALWIDLKFSQNAPLTIKEGDFLKGVEGRYFDNLLSYGILSIENLGENAGEDATHLDTDMSLIERDIATIPELLKEGLTACSFGDMRLLISWDYIQEFGDYVITKDKDGVKEFSEEDKKKMEIFCYSGNHWCITTGLSPAYVKAAIVSRDFDRHRFVAIKNNFAFPMYDTEGEIVFDYHDYHEGRKAMAGLAYYNMKEYPISHNLGTKEVLEVLPTLDCAQDDAQKKHSVIYSKLSSIFDKYFSGVKHGVDSSVSRGPIEFIDTGSTGRGTNVAGDDDFDFLVRLDRDFLESDLFPQFSKEIYEAFNQSDGDAKRIRMNGVKVEGIDQPLKIEITVIDKNAKIDYSTDDCIKDRLSTIQRLHPDKYRLVIANIVYAKKFFKELGIYKPYEGGLGGVGVENFILQHGGSFYDAVAHFVEVAHSSDDLKQFKRKFPIYDFGKNHYAYADTYKRVDFPYDNYINSLTEKSYSTILKAFEEYLGYQAEKQL